MMNVLVIGTSSGNRKRPERAVFKKVVHSKSLDLLVIFRSVESAVEPCNRSLSLIMDVSSEQLKEELDRLKSKYRKEALRAVAAADADGYARGVQEVREAAEKKISQWKAIAEAVTSNDNGSSKPVLLVQHIVEQLYRDMKYEYTNDSEITLAKLKVHQQHQNIHTKLIFFCFSPTGNTSFQHKQVDGESSRDSAEQKPPRHRNPHDSDSPRHRNPQPQLREDRNVFL